MALPVTLVTLGGVPVQLVDQTGSVFPTTGTGSLVFNTTPTLVTPILGAATGTSLALGGASLGSNALAVTGTAAISGSIGIGSNPAAYANLYVSKSITGSAFSYSVYISGNVQSDVSSVGGGYVTALGTQAASFTLPSLRHFYATQGTIGAGSTLTTQVGFLADSNLTGATNNYGFYGAIAAGTGRWNLYMAGTAANYLGGTLAVGGATIGSNALAVTGTASFGGAVLVGEAANVLAQRNSTTAQTFRIYNTYTDASNYERTNIRYSANVFEIGTTALGTGTTRILRLFGGSTILEIDSSSGVISANRAGSSAPTLLNLNSSGMTSTAVLFARLQPSINQASGAYTILDINPTETAIGAGPHYLIRGRLGAGANVFSVDRTGAATFGGALTVPGVTTAALTSTGTFTSGAGAQVGTLTNAPAAGNPTTWIKIIDNGVTRYIPAW